MASLSTILLVAGVVVVAEGVRRGWRRAAERRCPACREGPWVWTYARKGGGPDQRFALNPRYCPRCGWSSMSTLPEGNRPAVATSVSAHLGSAVAISTTLERRSGSFDEHLVAVTLERMARAEGRTARRAVVQSGLKQIGSAVEQARLIHEASKLEVGAVLEQAGRSPSRGSRRRLLERALAGLRDDEHADALQAEAIGMLEKALRDDDDR